MHPPCLVLNADYIPLTVVNWRRSISYYTLCCGIEVIEFYKHIRVRSSGGQLYRLPAIAVLSKYINIHKRPPRLNKKNLLIRDSYCCQYCNAELDRYNATIDHVVPKSQGGEHKWTNVVASCWPCNNKKRNKTPRQANMPLKREPKTPPRYALSFYVYKIPTEWENYVVISKM